MSKPHNYIYVLDEIIHDTKIIQDLGSELGIRKVIAQCKFCGNSFKVKYQSLKREHTQSCGCLKRKLAIERNTKHGLAFKTKLYGVWSSMKMRCNNPNTIMYYRYGGRGISVCDEWSNNYLSYHEWAILNGYKEGMSIDRIDNDGNYEPLNCRIVLKSEQSKHRLGVKLTDSDKKIICDLYISSNITQAALAKQFNVHDTRITQILKENSIKTTKRNQYGVWKNV